ncbi:MAG TPA: hypothetical protein VJ728_14020, partial [Candidatus Binataceae bacterium]|nr:hypothetical protein [Candidatus Binataceae bacterium]
PDVITLEATEIDPKGTVTLNGSVNPDGISVSACYFEYGISEAYDQRVACEPANVEGSEPVNVRASISGLEPGTTYHFRLAASNTNGTNYGNDVLFSLPPKPMIDAASAGELTPSSATLTAQINPGGIEVTDCHFDYGSTISYDHSEPCEQTLGAGNNDATVTLRIRGLAPNTTYHWRVVATNAAGTSTGADHTFIYDTSGEGLPDNRAYEMVTPSQKNGALIGDALFGNVRAVTEGGSSLIMTSIQCFADAESCTGSRMSEGEQFLFYRTQIGWLTTALAPPATRFESSTGALLEAESATVLFSIPTAPTSEDHFYVRKPTGSMIDIGPVTPAVGGAQGPLWDGAAMFASRGFSHIVFQEPSGLWPSSAAGIGETAFEYTGVANLEPALVGVSGEGTNATDLISACGTSLGSNNRNGGTPGVISADGKVVFFTSDVCASGTGDNSGKSLPVNELYARLDGSRTVPISEPAAFGNAAPYAGCSEVSCIEAVNSQSNWSNAEFAGSSKDGSRAFFTTNQRLTDGAGTVGNLYEYALDNPQGERLTDVSAGDKSGQGPRVLGVIAISSDGSRVYFVARSVLSTNQNENDEVAQDGANNLYIFERSKESPTSQVQFIARLSDADQQQWITNNQEGKANVTPSGRFLVFESHAALTPDLTRKDGSAQIFRYDADTGSLVRVSTGQRGFADNGNAGFGNAQIVPAIRGYGHTGPARSDPTMSHDGSFIFFESPVGLTSSALNDVRVGTFEGQPSYVENIYEWHDGEVHLLSDAKDTTVGPTGRSAVELVGSDATGSNVFFSTTDELVAQDTDTQLDYYDARICTDVDPCLPKASPALPPCLEEVCHGIPAAAPLEPSGATSTLNGPGNLSKKPAIAKKHPRRKRSHICSRARRRKRHRCRSRRAPVSKAKSPSKAPHRRGF